MNKVLTQLAISLVVLIVGTFIGVVVEQNRSESEGRLRYLDREIRMSKSILSRPAIYKKKLELLIDGKSIDDISSVEVKLYNYSDLDYEKVPIYNELTPTSEEPITILSESVTGANQLQEGVSPLDSVHRSTIPGAVRFGYKINALNRSSDFNYSFAATYFVLRSSPPEPKVAINKKGLDLREFSYNHAFRKSWIGEVAPVIGLVAGFIAYGAMFFVGIRFARRKIQKQDEKLLQEMERTFSSDEIRKSHHLGDQFSPNQLAQTIVDLYKKFRWNSTPKGFRLFSGIPKPDDA